MDRLQEHAQQYLDGLITDRELIVYVILDLEVIIRDGTPDDVGKHDDVATFLAKALNKEVVAA